MKYIDADCLQEELEKLSDGRKRPQFNRMEELAYIRAIEEVKEIIDSLLQEPLKEICSKCIYHGRDDDYCYNPHGGMRSLINENGVYECTGFCEREQEQPEVDMEKASRNVYESWMGGTMNDVRRDMVELGKVLNSRKEG